MMQYFEVSSIDNSLRKAVLDGVVNKLLQESGVTSSEIVYSDDDNDTRAQAGSRIGTDRGVSYGVNGKTMVEFNEERNDDNRHARGIGLNRELPIFWDKATGTQLQPNMTQYDVELTVVRNSPSKDILQRWVNRLNSLLDMGRASTVFDVESFYYIPMPSIELLHAVWTAVNGAGVKYPTFTDYLKAHLHRSVTTTSGQSGGQKRLAGRINLTRIEVVYDTTSPSRDKNESQFSAQLQVRFSYWRPDEVQCWYPTSIRQTLIAEKWREQPEPTYLSNDELVEMSNVQHSYDELAAWGVIRLPVWEGGKDTANKVIPNRPNAEAPIWGVDVVFPEPDSSGNNDILGWDDLPITWDDSVQDYIDTCIEKDPSGKNCVINFVIYINGHPCSPDELEWINGRLVLKINIDIEVTYYLTYRFILDWRQMVYDDLLLLRDHADALNKIMDWVMPDKPKPGLLPSGKVDWEDFDKVVNDFTPETVTDAFWCRAVNTTIMTFKKEIQ